MKLLQTEIINLQRLIINLQRFRRQHAHLSALSTSTTLGRHGKGVKTESELEWACCREESHTIHHYPLSFQSDLVERIPYYSDQVKVRGLSCDCSYTMTRERCSPLSQSTSIMATTATSAASEQFFSTMCHIKLYLESKMKCLTECFMQHM